MFDYKIEHLFSYVVTLDSNIEVIGPTPEGIRANVYIKGGEITGPHLTGKIRPVGADWLTVRPDGVGVMDVKATFETDDGALIYTDYSGVIEAGEDGYQRFMEGNLLPVMQIRAVPRYITAHPDYLWLNRLQCVNIGQVEFLADHIKVSYDVYGLK